MTTIHQRFGCASIIAGLNDPLAPRYVGLECEIEGIRSHGNAEKLGFSVTNDGSLRNNGYEYITSAVKIPEALGMFQDLHSTLSTKPSDKFSQRTSTHVHVNCMAYEEETVKRIIWLYALFEEAFFLLVDSERRDNIHCVPLTETHLPAIYNASLIALVDRWSKYTALNIKPLGTQGTIEFRHMHGHDDVEVMRQWLGSINSLFDLALRTPVIDAKFLEDESLRNAFNAIFGDTKLKDQWVLIRGMMVNQIIDIKLVVA